MKKKKMVPLLPSELPEYMVMGFFRKVQWLTTRQARRVLSLRKKMVIENARRNGNKKKREQLHSNLERTYALLSDVLGDLTVSSLLEFKQQRKVLLDGLKQEFMERLGGFDLNDFATKACQEEILAFKQAPTQKVLKRLFKPQFGQGAAHWPSSFHGHRGRNCARARVLRSSRDPPESSRRLGNAIRHAPRAPARYRLAAAQRGSWSL